MRLEFSLVKLAKISTLLIILSDLLQIACACSVHHLSAPISELLINLGLLLISNTLPYPKVNRSTLRRNQASAAVWSFIRDDVLIPNFFLRCGFYGFRTIRSAILVAISACSLHFCTCAIAVSICYILFSAGYCELAERIYKPLDTIETFPSSESFSQKFSWKKGLGHAAYLKNSASLIQSIYGTESIQMAKWHYAVAEIAIGECHEFRVAAELSHSSDVALDLKLKTMRTSVEKELKKALVIFRMHGSAVDELQTLAEIARSQYLREDDIDASITLDHGVKAAEKCLETPQLAIELKRLAEIERGEENFEQSKLLVSRAMQIESQITTSNARGDSRALTSVLLIFIIFIAIRLSKQRLTRTANKLWLRQFYSSTNMFDSLQILEKLSLYEQSRGNMEQANSYSQKAVELVEAQ